MYFALDESRRIVVGEDGIDYTVEEFKKILSRGVVVDMTQMLQRFVLFNFDFDRLADFYDNN